MDVFAAKPCQEVREAKADQLQECAPRPRALEMCAPHMSFTEETMSLLTTSSLLARSLLGTRQVKPKDTSSINRRKREFIPEEKKDSNYWDKRKKNNEAAKRSREKRRVNDMVLEQRVIALLEENARLKAELLALKFRFGLIKDPSETPATQSNPPPLCCMTGIQTPFVARSENGCVTHPVDNKSFPPNKQPLGASLGPEPQESCVVSEDSGISTPGSSSIGSPVFFDDHLSDQGKFSPNHEDHFEGQLSSSSDVEVDLSRIGSSENVKPARSQELMEMVKCLPHKLRFKIGAGVEESTEVDVRLKVFQMAAGNSTIRTVPEQPAGQVRDQLQGCYTNTLPHSDRESGPDLPSPAWRAHVGFLPGENRSGLNRRYFQEVAQVSGQAVSDNPKNPPKEDSKSENSILRNQLASLSAEVAQLKKMFSQQRCSSFN
ncbi:nuclear factor, interleukin 3 regulated, member 6 [Pristis pectinata]|uniref:nuclear factor, interleukin 3 regulated, member 6 n=1 Tax=Pristis pectinata TaxID=685728 RepID=UPI00223E68A9|nr:nuclear factor, interleukin 3 regulated, member 6 [Pristis pectinata]XP_051898024.1 nuclear factor, interleukin 3 regulated, member 6 [Pristis pectinata]XP_051898025.1 nuclear factor, interleukin 3 regulated, member 6 [Pristis pectinata]